MEGKDAELNNFQMESLMKSMEEILEMNKSQSHVNEYNIKVAVLDYALGITATSFGREMLCGLRTMLEYLIDLAQDPSISISKDAASALINITGDETGTNALLLIAESNSSVDRKMKINLIEICIKAIMDKSSLLADPCCMILSNMTRPFHLVDRVITLIEQCGYTWDAIVAAFTANQYNTAGAKMHYLGQVFNNLSQSACMRSYLMDRDHCIIQRLCPFTQHSDIIRRSGIVGTLKNCTFDTKNHEWLLSPEVDILSYLLLPLAGPEEFDDEDNDKLPCNLQYLPETKTREIDPDIRLILLEALYQLCATKAAREIMREKNIYIILREFHKWEKDSNILLACKNVVDILIKTEEEIDVDNLKDMKVPSKYTKKFHEMDKEMNDTM